MSFWEQIAEYDEPRQTGAEVKPTQMIVTSLKEPVFVLPKPLILKSPKQNEEPVTIATRLKTCRSKAQIVNDTPEGTIVDRVARRQ